MGQRPLEAEQQAALKKSKWACMAGQGRVKGMAGRGEDW